MTPSAFAKLAAAQAPKPGKLTLDHIAHFVPHMDVAAPALEKLGFTLTPFSAQSHRLEPGGPLLPAGTGNRCIMLKRGYLECLAPTGDTPVANQLRTAIQRYVGVHSIIFGTGAADADHARLAREGFSPLEPIALQRQLMTQDGEHTARFTVVRVAPGTMPEGRIQYCQHHTPEFVWQPQWVQHANRATALTAVILCMDDPAEAAARYGRFTRSGSIHSWRNRGHSGWPRRVRRSRCPRHSSRSSTGRPQCRRRCSVARRSRGSCSRRVAS